MKVLYVTPQVKVDAKTKTYLDEYKAQKKEKRQSTDDTKVPLLAQGATCPVYASSLPVMATFLRARYCGQYASTTNIIIALATTSPDGKCDNFSSNFKSCFTI